MPLGRSTSVSIDFDMLPEGGGTPPPRWSRPRRAPSTTLTELVAATALVIVGLDMKVALGATAALGVAVVLLPVWLPSLRAYPLAAVILAVGAIAILSGVLLSERALESHALDRSARIQSIGLLVSGFGGLVLTLWARRVLPTWQVVTMYAAGGILGSLLEGNLSWKFALAAPTTLLVTAVVERASRTRAAIAVIALGVVTVFDDGRSFLGFCVLAAVLALWQTRPATGWRGRWQPALVLAAMSFVLYQLFVSLLTGGYLGSEAQERTTQQIETSGSLLIGGRPEFAATRHLVESRPEGFGLGVVPAWEDIRTARHGLAEVNVELEPVRLRYMFGGQFRLHSIAADLWAACGVVGVALAVLLGLSIIRSLSFALASRTAPVSVILASVMGLWHLLFGPIYSNWADLCASVGLVLISTWTDPDALPPVQGRSAVAPPARD